MSTFAHLATHIRTYREKHRFLYIFSTYTFCVYVFSGIIAYMTPIVFLRNGLTQTQMGLVLGSSAFFGAVLDIIFSKILPSTHYKHLYILLTLVSFALIASLANATSLPMFFLVAALSGLFYNLLHMGAFDFVSRETNPQEHASSFGILNVFKALGLIAAPLALAFTYFGTRSASPFFSALLWAGISMGVLSTLLILKEQSQKKAFHHEPPHYKKMKFLLELHLWKKIGRKLFPVLLFTLMIGMQVSLFWTLAPVLSEQLKGTHATGALFIPLYILPTLLVGWFVGPVTKIFGQKNTAYWFYIIGALIMACIAFVHETQEIVILGFLSSLFGGFSIPAISGAYADYLSEAPKLDKEIESLEDFFSNVGCIIGPIFGGILADKVGIQNTFALFSIFAIVCTLWIIKISPKKITVTS